MLPLIYYTPLRRFYRYKERYPYGLKNETLRKWVVREMKAATSTTSASGFSAEGLFQTQRLISTVRKTLDKVRCPTLIIHAKDDDVASQRSADLVESRISSAVKKKIILGNSYHVVTLDNEKEVVAAETIDFFNNNLNPSCHSLA